MKKNALVITYHVKNCQRVGGFHYFINYLEKLSYDIDWVTCPISLSWVLHHNDRENKKNFIDLWRGITFEENGVTVRHFSTPVFIPAKIAKIMGMKIGEHYWPDWKRVRKRLKHNYDVILVEGVGCQYASDLRYNYREARIIYRPSDILETFSEIPDAVELEKRMMEAADITVCVDENQQQYYKRIGSPDNNIQVLRNPMTTEADREFLKNWIPKEISQKSVVYMGVSCVDLNVIEYAASKLKYVRFYIIGPHRGKTHDNIEYLGVLNKKQFEYYLENANVGISTLNEEMFGKNNIALPGYTRKFISYMKYLLPIVTMYYSNYLNIKGFYVSNCKEKFYELIKEALAFSVQDREKLREDYLMVMKLFSAADVESEFKKILVSLNI